MGRRLSWDAPKQWSAGRLGDDLDRPAPARRVLGSIGDPASRQGPKGLSLVRLRNKPVCAVP
jgi:hypothetical protein